MEHTSDWKRRLPRVRSGNPCDELRVEYLALLDAYYPEQIYQNFIERNTRLVPREFIQNHVIHFDLALRKIPFGADYRSDFAYRQMIAAQERDDFKIMTFDSLAEALHTKHELYVGSRKNEYVDILSGKFISETIFSWVQPEQLRIRKRLKESALQARASWNHYAVVDGKMVLAMEKALGSVRIRN